MENKNNQNLIIGVVVVVLLVLAGIWIFSGNSGTVANNYPSPSATSTPDTSALATDGTDVGFNDLQPSIAPAAALSYINALKLYTNYRVQFGPSVATNFASCVTGANSLTFKNNTKIMLDNRSAVTSTIKIGGVSYTLAPYQFRIITLSSATLPITYGVDCNQYQNVVSIMLQK